MEKPLVLDAGDVPWGDREQGPSSSLRGGRALDRLSWVEENLRLSLPRGSGTRKKSQSRDCKNSSLALRGQSGERKDRKE